MKSKKSSEKNFFLKLNFKGTMIAIQGTIPDFLLNQFNHHLFQNYYSFYPKDYYQILDLLESNNVKYESTISSLKSKNMDDQLKSNLSLLEFQQEAIDAWLSNSNKGTIILPTGSGKTIIAIKIIELLKVTTLIIVPTIVLIEQWINRIESYLNYEAGQFGGGKQEVKAITVITYDSAHLYLQRLRDQFGLIVLDEAHHLSGQYYETIADCFTSPYRLALTATLDSSDASYDSLMNKGFGPIVYQKSVIALQEYEILSDFEINTIKVKVADIEEYNRNIKILSSYLKKMSYINNSIPLFQQIIFRINKDRDAQKALDAFKKAKYLSFAHDRKLIELEKLLRDHRQDKMIIFSDFVEFCERIQRTFFIPCITHRTHSKERAWILNYFNRNYNAKIVVSKVLDEGIDIKDAKIGVIISGSGKRQFIQRLGRILRRHPEKEKAILYEIVSEETFEERVAQRRKSSVSC